jgi:hypothetical protein
MKKLITALAATAFTIAFAATSNADNEFNCRAFDPDGSVIGETNASGAIDCSRKMFDVVREARCEANKGKSYRYSIQAPKTNRRTPQSIFCKSR